MPAPCRTPFSTASTFQVSPPMTRASSRSSIVAPSKRLGYSSADVINKLTPADISDPLELIARANALSVELSAPITPGFEALVFKASRGIEDIYELTYIRKDGSRFPRSSR